MAKTRELQRTQVWLPVPMVDWLKARAKEQGVSYAELVRRALDLYRDFKESETDLKSQMDQMMADDLGAVIESHQEEESQVLVRLDALEQSLARIENRLNAII